MQEIRNKEPIFIYFFW